MSLWLVGEESFLGVPFFDRGDLADLGRFLLGVLFSLPFASSSSDNSFESVGPPPLGRHRCRLHFPAPLNDPYLHPLTPPSHLCHPDLHPLTPSVSYLSLSLGPGPFLSTPLEHRQAVGQLPARKILQLVAFFAGPA